MINYLSLDIKSLSINFVGNKVKEEGVFLSKKSITEIDDFTKEALIRYFIESFKIEVFYNFQHISDLNMNEVFNYISLIFESPKQFHKISLDLTRFLYDKTSHPNIKGGEFFVVYFQNIQLDNVMMDAIGLFKSESKETFLEILPEIDNYKIESHSGIDIKKLDKGCLIFNTSKKEGYKICVIDNLNKSNEAQYWKNDFLNVKPVSDNYHFTKDFLTITKDYIATQVSQDFDMSKADQIDLLNKSVQYFKENETFDIYAFEKEIFEDKAMINSFRKFGTAYGEKNNIDIMETFEISPQAVKKQSRIFKSVLKLDRNFHIYIHGDKELIEKGFDAEKNMNYYKVYFRDEQ